MNRRGSGAGCFDDDGLELLQNLLRGCLNRFVVSTALDNDKWTAQLENYATRFEVYAYASVVFGVVDVLDTFPPNISESSILNKTYNSEAIPLSFSVDENPSWIGYCLDGFANVTLVGNTTISGLSEGSHSLVIYSNDTAGNMGASSTVFFSVILPTPMPALTASLSESASALNYGNTINFTVTTEGGTPPYAYAWYMDGQSSENSSSPYFSTDSQTVGSHHVYVQVTDSDNNSATTLTVEFNVLPSSSPSSSSSPTQQPTSTPTQSATPTIVPIVDGVNSLPYTIGIIAVVIVAITVVGLVVYLTKFRKKKKG